MFENLTSANTVLRLSKATMIALSKLKSLERLSALKQSGLLDRAGREQFGAQRQEHIEHDADAGQVFGRETAA